MVDSNTKRGTASNNFMYIGIFKCLCDTLGPSNNDVISCNLSRSIVVLQIEEFLPAFLSLNAQEPMTMV